MAADPAKAKQSASARPVPEVHSSVASPKELTLTSKTALNLFAAVNVTAALCAPIQDCDEVFNYWEPAHYLSHGYGLQTWEYSPEYAIRSWLYVGLHAAVGKLVYLLTASKTFEFYSIRIALALLCAFCQTRLYTAVSKALNPRIGMTLMAVMLTSPGMFHAAPAFLPSSFSMYASMLGAAEFIDWRGGSATQVGIMYFGIGALIGWPFAAALVVPFILNEYFMAAMIEQRVEFVRKTLDGTVRCTAFMTLQFAIETFFYRKAVIVPWNIVAYNVFGGAGKGPNIFGTEPWDFYIRNLILNFNFWVLLALISAPLLAIQYASGSHPSAYGLLKNSVFVSPFYMWLGIFTLQPHKEERFIYPAYPFLALSAAISLHVVLSWLGNASPRSLIGKVPAKLRLAVVGLTVVLAIDVGVLRTLGMIEAYRAPFQVYSKLSNETGLGSQTSVCIGKEWYRFPSSFFLPKDAHAKFVRSEFKGLLPGEFSEAKTGFGFFPGSWLVPAGMNDMNIEDPDKYTNINHCDYLIDVSYPNVAPTFKEPDYIKDMSNWERLHCEPFLDASSTHLIARLLWLPQSLAPQRLQRKWGDYCLLKRQNIR